MTEIEQECACLRCGHPAGTPPAAPDAWQCSMCGGRQLRFSIVARDRIALHEMARGRVKEPGGKRPKVEFMEGDNLHCKSGRWMRRSQLIDRRNDHYREAVSDPKTGEVVHECDEPLSEHRGHGSAKETRGRNAE